MKIPWSTEKFIIEAQKKHHDSYDYSKVKYIKNILPVEIICRIHGVFIQTPQNHLKGKGCRFCANNVKLTTLEFIERAKKIHGNKYDYSLVNYKRNRKLITIICKQHGNFQALPTNHLRGVECEKCGIDKRAFNQRLPLSDFILRSNKIHNNYYNYDNVIFINTKVKVIIKCPKHGCFSQKPESHMKGVGCPKCNMSKGELEIIRYLENNMINYVYQKRFHDCKYKSYLYFDFYLPELNICVEFDGEQHSRSIPRFGGEKAFELLKIRDNIKNMYCAENNIQLIRISDLKEVNSTLEKILKF